MISASQSAFRFRLVCRLDLMRAKPLRQSSFTATFIRSNSTISNDNTAIWHYEWKNTNTASNELPTNNKTVGPPLVFLHGLLGNSRNLQTMVTKLSKATQRPALTLDIRGHGKTNKLLKQNNEVTKDDLDASNIMSTCVQETRATLDAAKSNMDNFTMIGHSLGGRLTLEYAATALVASDNAAFAMPTQIWLLDTIPGQAFYSVLQVLDVASKVINSIDNDDSVVNLVHKLHDDYKLDMPTSQWLASSYQAKSKDFSFDLPTAYLLVQGLRDQPFMKLLKQVLDSQMDVHLVRGGLNKGWEDSGKLPQLEELSRQYENFTIHTLQKAGHWVHIDDLPGLLQIIEKHIK